MSWSDFSRDRLLEHLDASGDLAPPWERFPTYERYTIGWRMGVGEDWLGLWHVFLQDLDPAFAVRLAYLKRHPPAPMNWANRVYGVLHPTAPDEGDEDAAQLAIQHRAGLLGLGVIASDAAYPIWRSQQRDVRWPWELSEPDESPEIVARHWTRDLWFWSRRVVELRSDPAWVPPQVPGNWRVCAPALESGRVPALDPRKGLRSLVQVLAAGRVVPPWELGLGTSDFADSFDTDMGYADAFRLWGMSAFDDREHLQRDLATGAVPDSWARWIEEQFHLE